MHDVQYEQLTLTVPEVARMLRISRGAAYEAVRRGEIPTLRLGKRLLVPRVALEQLLNTPSGSPNSNEAVVC